jgi:hypothetical protein
MSFSACHGCGCMAPEGPCLLEEADSLRGLFTEPECCLGCVTVVETSTKLYVHEFGFLEDKEQVGFLLLVFFIYGCGK